MRRPVPGDDAEIVDLLVRVFGPGDDDGSRRTEAWWRWKYPDNPEGHQSLVAEGPDGRLVGFYGGVTLPVRIDGATWQFGQASDTCTDPRVRRGLRNPGLFVRLAQAYLSTTAQPSRDAVGYGLPMPEAYRMGSRFLDYWMTRSQFLLVCTAAGRIPAPPPGVTVDEVAAFPDDADAFLRDVESEYRCLARRDRRFLDWRFTHHPQRPYRMAVARDRSGALRGHVVLRGGRLAGRMTGVIMDWLTRHDDLPAAEALVRWAAMRTRESGLSSVTFLCPTASRWFERFQTWGFRAEPSPYVMVARCVQPAIQPDFVREHWYYTQADFDLL